MSSTNIHRSFVRKTRAGIVSVLCSGWGGLPKCFRVGDTVSSLSSRWKADMLEPHWVFFNLDVHRPLTPFFFTHLFDPRWEVFRRVIHEVFGAFAPATTLKMESKTPQRGSNVSVTSFCQREDRPLTVSRLLPGNTLATPLHPGRILQQQHSIHRTE